jgi:hypothetical protein
MYNDNRNNENELLTIIDYYRFNQTLGTKLNQLQNFLIISDNIR